MKVVRLYMNNPLRNFNYVIGCEETREAIALDPLDGEAVVAAAEKEGWSIRMIINTHEHHDHIMGNPAVRAATGAPVWASEHAVGRIPDVDHGIKANEVITLGNLSFRALPTPGHTSAHVCLLTLSEPVPALFSGDTIFNACAGNCFNGGNVDDMYETFVRELEPLPDKTILYPGHDYMKNNLGFAQSREPGNPDINVWQDKTELLSPDEMPLMTLGQERSYNPFLRLENGTIRSVLESENPDLDVSSDREVFRALRALRDKW